jgi:hypothetical protein
MIAPGSETTDPRRITMKTNPYRSHPIAAALAATFVTTVLVSTLVDSFEPGQLIELNRKAAGAPIVAVVRRPESDLSRLG